MPNVHCLIGNHELMALECMEFLLQKITDDSIKEFSVYEEISVGDRDYLLVHAGIYFSTQ